MMTVKQVSELTGVSVRTLQYYDRIGLLKPTKLTDAGYRLYDDTALERLQQILLYRELEFPLKEIKAILDSPQFDRSKALSQQIELLQFKLEHIERLLHFARGIKLLGGKAVDFTAFDRTALEEYARKAREQWGDTAAYQEYAGKVHTAQDQEQLAEEMMAIFAAFGAMKTEDPASDPVQQQVKRLQEHITQHYYTCTNEILSSLGTMYVADDAFTRNIDNAGGIGTAAFVARAIEVYCAGCK